MAKQKLLSDILKDLIDLASFIVTYYTVADNGDGTYTIGGICDLHHIQPGFKITINGIDYTVKDYSEIGNRFEVILEGASAPTAPGTIELYKPFYIHGTPIQADAELTKVPLDIKTPMIYLMEPYDTELDYSVMTAIDRRCKFTLCFLTQADISKWLTDDFYHNAINPMYNLAQDFIDEIIECNLFNNVNQTASPKFYTKFGINIKSTGTAKLYFSENLSGVGLDISLDIYKVNDCCSNTGVIDSDVELREDNSVELRESTGMELR